MQLSREALMMCSAGAILLAVRSAEACGGGAPSEPVCNIARCTADSTWVAWPVTAGTACGVNGVAGRCDGGVIIAGQIEPDQIGQCVLQQTSTVQPLYFINGVMYSPPGRTSIATSTTGSVIEVTVSSAASFNSDVSLTASVDSIGGIAGDGISVTVSKGDGKTTADGKDFKLSMQTSQPVQSNGGDMVDHAADRIYIWPKPTINVVVQPPVGTSIMNQGSWSFGPATGQGPFFSFAQWLINPSTMPANVANYLNNFGVTSQYYNEIVQNADPFALGSNQLDASRFILQRHFAI